MAGIRKNPNYITNKQLGIRIYTIALETEGCMFFAELGKIFMQLAQNLSQREIDELLQKYPSGAELIEALPEG